MALLIKIDSPGPVFHIQKRKGKNCKLFNFIKFRTMRSSETGIKYNPVVKADDRITRAGAFLRKTNLDEIPQIINVLMGEMSFVGPRPHLPVYDEEYSKYAINLNFRYAVKPGITGLAQISGFRGDSINETENKLLINKRIELDLEYIEKQSFLFDLKILAKTVLILFGVKSSSLI